MEQYKTIENKTKIKTKQKKGERNPQKLDLKTYFKI